MSVDGTRIRVMVAEDENLLRDALAALVAGEPSLEFVGAAADADAAVALASSERPDVALLDVRMPGGGGYRAARGIRERSPQTRVIALSAYDDRTTVLEMVRAGVVGYLVKGAPPGEIVKTIHRSAMGQGALSGEVAAGVIAELGGLLEHQEHESALFRERLERVETVVQGHGPTMVFQPIYHLGQRVPVAYEALARFAPEPVRGPDVWFAEADDVGLGTALQITAARLAMRDLPSIPEYMYLSVNLSPDSILAPAFSQLAESMPAKRIALELTEHARVDDYEGLAKVLTPLRDQGMQLAVDDAGAGFASLRHILQLQPDIIKLDITLTRDVDADGARRALAAALITFAGEIGASIVAEGIESEREIDALVGLGVRYGQGYHLARPGPLPA